MSSRNGRWRRPRGRRHLLRACWLAMVLTLLGGAPAFAADRAPLHHGGDVGVGGADPLEIGARIALLLGTAAVAGIGLFRGSITEVTRTLRMLAWVAAALACAALLVSVLWLNVNVPVGLAQLAVTLALPVLLRWPTWALSGGLLLALVLTGETAVGHGGMLFLADTVFTVSAVVWFGLAAVAIAVPSRSRLPTSFRPGPLALTISAALVAAGIGQLVLSGLGLDRRIYSSAFGLTLLLVVLVPVVVVVLTTLALRAERTGPWRAYRVGVAGVAVAFVACGSLAAIPKPPQLPAPGVPLLATVDLAGKQSSVLLSPQRPGRNLVHLPESLDGARVGVAGERLRPVAAQPGTGGRWAVIDLPRGRSELTVDLRGEQATVDVDTGERAGGPAAATGPDGPECASAALGASLAGQRKVLTECPADRLSTGDAASLRSTVRFFADRNTPAITVFADGSTRASQARQVLREAARAEQIRLTTTPGRDNALLLVSGWRAAAAKLDAVKHRQAASTVYNRGVYLAPWLLNSSLMKTTASSLLPLTFDPREQDALEYVLAVRQAFPEEAPTLGGFRSWMAGRNRSVDGPVQLYAAAQVDVWQLNTQAPIKANPAANHHGAGVGQWLPGGTIIPATGVLR